MHRSLTLVVVAGVAFVAGFCLGRSGIRHPVDAPPNDLAVGPCTVTKVVDGDTVRVDCGEWVAPCPKWPRVRLLNINTPERGKPRHDEATAALRKLVLGHDVYLRFEDPREPTCGGYGRLLAYLLVDGVNVNVEMVREGWSEFETKYGEGRFAGDFEAAERRRER